MAQRGDWSIYEWDVEEVMYYDDGESDVQEHFFQESFNGCLKEIKRTPHDGCVFEIVLVLDTDDGRSWAYLDKSTMLLPEYFEDANGCDTRKVPKRFQKEIVKALGKQGTPLE